MNKIKANVLCIPCFSFKQNHEWDKRTSIIAHFHSMITFCLLMLVFPRKVSKRFAKFILVEEIENTNRNNYMPPSEGQPHNQTQSTPHTKRDTVEINISGLEEPIQTQLVCH